MASNWLVTACGTAAIAMSGSAALSDVIVDVPPSGFAMLSTQTGLQGDAGSSDWWDTAESGAVMTNWAGETLTYVFDAGPTPTLTMLGVTAKNFWGPLPTTYSTFEVAVSVDGAYVDTLHILASDTQWNTGWVNIGVRGGPVTITVAWLNDAWEPGVADANIGVGAVSLASVPSAGSISLASLGLLLSGTRRRR